MRIRLFGSFDAEPSYSQACGNYINFHWFWRGACSGIDINSYRDIGRAVRC